LNGKGSLAFLDPRCIYDRDTERDEKSDIFSLGVVLWEISSRRKPCGGLLYDNDIITYRLDGKRDASVSVTPEEYITLYSECWDDDAERRPSCEQIFDQLTIIAQKITTTKHHSTVKLTNMYQQIVLEHSLSDKLSNIYQEECLKGSAQIGR